MRRAGSERGQTLLEYTVVILTVLTVIFGVFETGRLMLTYATLAEAARAGERTKIAVFSRDRDVDCVGACVPDNGATTAQNVASAAGITLASYTPNYNPSGTNVPGTLLTVTVTYTFVPITPLVALGIPLTSTTESMVLY